MPCSDFLSWSCPVFYYFVVLWRFLVSSAFHVRFDVLLLKRSGATLCFTSAPVPAGRQKGISKTQCGAICDWILHPAGATRIEQQQDHSEIVLEKKPIVLLIEVPTSKLPMCHAKKNYELNITVRSWSLGGDNQVQVKRDGCPIVNARCSHQSRRRAT